MREYQMQRSHGFPQTVSLSLSEQPSKTNSNPLSHSQTALPDATKGITGAVIHYNRFPRALTAGLPMLSSCGGRIANGAYTV